MRKWHLEKRYIDDLHEHTRNARCLTQHEKKHLMTSMAKFGLIDKPIINYEGMIIGGHQRVKVLKEMGHYEVECWVADGEDLTEEEIDELNIRLNKNTGEWDWDKLANEWDINLLCEWGFTVKDFHDEGKGKLEGKPKVILEFEDQKALDDTMSLIKDIQIYAEDRVKIKVKVA